jgi:hypothetical protein
MVIPRTKNGIIMKNSQAINSKSFSLSIRSHNPKSIQLIKAISKDDSKAVNDIIDSAVTFDEKLKILNSCFVQEPGCREITKHKNIAYHYAVSMKNKNIIEKISNIVKLLKIFDSVDNLCLKELVESVNYEQTFSSDYKTTTNHFDATDLVGNVPLSVSAC